MRTCYVNGDYVLENAAKISIFDRGFLFSDGVYEVSMIYNGKLVDNDGHLKRLARSCEKLGINLALSNEQLTDIQQTLIDKNQISSGAIYLQVTRGADTDRDFLYSDNIKPTLVMIPQHKTFDPAMPAKGLSVMSMPEIRWAHRDIKAVGLLGAVLAKKLAKDQGYDDAWFVENGHITEGSSNNIFLVKGDKIITKAANTQILNGITRQAVLKVANELNLVVVESDFSVTEAQQADEVFATSATMTVMSVCAIDDVKVGNGQPGKISEKIRAAYFSYL